MEEETSCSPPASPPAPSSAPCNPCDGTSALSSLSSLSAGPLAPPASSLVVAGGGLFDYPLDGVDGLSGPSSLEANAGEDAQDPSDLHDALMQLGQNNNNNHGDAGRGSPVDEIDFIPLQQDANGNNNEVVHGPLPDPSTMTGDPDIDAGVGGGDLNMLYFLGEASGAAAGPEFMGPELPVENTRVNKADAVQGICGLDNMGNTCYMNSGLQCLFATPAFVNFFHQHLPTVPPAAAENNSDKTKDKAMDDDAAGSVSLSREFAMLLRGVWQGEFERIRPATFKRDLGLRCNQFEGSLQHDCQEFVGALLDQLHEGLLVEQRAVKDRSECNTSMELNASQSVEKQADVDELLSGNGPPQLKCKLLEDDKADGTESRGSASPKSYGSHSSLEDKVGPAIRSQPIPDHVGSFNARSVGDLDERLSLPEEDDNTMDSTESSSKSSSTVALNGSAQQQPTSNLVAPDSLKRPSGTGTSPLAAAGSTNGHNGTADDANNLGNVSIADYAKDCKTLNVNVLSDKEKEDGYIRNNELSFDSEKFSKEKRIRPQTTIENLNLAEAVGDSLTEHDISKQPESSSLGGLEIAVNGKRFKETNVFENGEVEVSAADGVSPPPTQAAEFNGIKRMRLNSAEKEKNLQLEMERKKQQQTGSEATGVDDNAMEPMEVAEMGEEVSGAQALPLGAVGVSGVAHDSGSVAAAVAAPGRLEGAIEADRYWDKHRACNNTVVARTFEGQFKNTVVCSVCKHPSISFEPFMYLPVPLPNAITKQMEVTFINAQGVPTKYLLTLIQSDKVADVKLKMARAAFGLQKGQNVEDCVLNSMAVVEVLDGHITKTLEGYTHLRHISSDREVAVIQVMNHDGPLCASEEREVSSTSTPPPPLPNLKLQQEEISSSSMDVVDASADQSLPRNRKSSTTSEGKVVGAVVESSSSASLHNNSGSSTVAMADVSSSSDNNGGGGDNVGELLDISGEAKVDTAVVLVPNVELPPPPPPPPQTTSIEFQSCVICMEDFPPSDLRQHNACSSCVMCNPCIERSLEHHESNKDTPKGFIQCPSCRQNADPATEFVPINMVGVSKPKRRIFTLPLLVRHVQPAQNDNNTKEEITLLSSTLLRVPNQLEGRQLHELVDPWLKADGFEIVLTDSPGKLCSRCMFNERCRGCEVIANSSDLVLLQPSDAIAISFKSSDPSSLSCLRALYATLEHPSLLAERLPEKLELEECLAAFSESETLDDNNPWYCPKCKKNQCATKTLTVWRFPDCLIIYLKRFMYIESQSVKLDKAVNFPLQDMDLRRFLSGPLQSDDQTKFDLYSIVNHFGTITGGHYTAYTMHQPTERWNEMDDGYANLGVTPGGKTRDAESAYVLFYQRKGAASDFTCPPKRPKQVSPPPPPTNGIDVPMSTDDDDQRIADPIAVKTDNNINSNVIPKRRKQGSEDSYKSSEDSSNPADEYDSLPGPPSSVMSLFFPSGSTARRFP